MDLWNLLENNYILLLNGKRLKDLFFNFLEHIN